jgi:hypothetical protein
MSALERKEQLAALLVEYQASQNGQKPGESSEETIRTWLNDLLKIFGWDVRNTAQILQEKNLDNTAKAKLDDIDSTNIRPDYTFRLGQQKLTFLDAKSVDTELSGNAKAAFQIKSYGWSISAPCAFLSNFEEFAIYDCTYMPDKDQPANMGRIYLKSADYLDNFELLDRHLFKDNVCSGRLHEIYGQVGMVGACPRITPEFKFAEYLSAFRLRLANEILKNNDQLDIAAISQLVQIVLCRILFIRVCEARNLELSGLLQEFQRIGFWDAFQNSSYTEFFAKYGSPLFQRQKSLQKISISNEVFDDLLQHFYYPSPYRFDVIPVELLSNIYEIFLSRRLVIEKGKLKEELKSEYLKAKGAVSTPPYLVKEVIKQTISKSAIKRSGIKQIFSQKILDIACGSGIFALEACKYIEELFVEMYTAAPDSDFSQYVLRTGDGWVPTVAGKKALLEHCIFAIDIDPEAVEVTKMSLALHVVDAAEYVEVYDKLGLSGEKILEGVGTNVKCGNSLVGKDIGMMYPAIKQDLDEYIRTNPFEWKGKDGFPDVFAKKTVLTM